jgi:hypothetical protein
VERDAGIADERGRRAIDVARGGRDGRDEERTREIVAMLQSPRRLD